MRKPPGYESLSVWTGEVARGPYPPSGFLPVNDASLGNGDYYGLYWPLGRENEEPIVCDMYHDEGRIVPVFSSVRVFLAWLEANAGERGDVEVADAESGPALFERARPCIARGDVQEAIALLQRACRAVPDMADWWLALAGQLRRSGAQEQGIEAALQAYRCNWAFGAATEPVLRFVRAGRNLASFADDPIVQRSLELDAGFGGAKENRNYGLLQECIAEYFARGEPVKALQVHHNRAFMLASETVAFQERYGFDLQVWRAEFSQLCAMHLGDARVEVD